jgi:PmbA protein
MVPRLLAALQAQPGVNDWTLRRQVSRGVQIYLLGATVENVRQTSREAYEVEVYNDHQHDGETVRGSATVPCAPDDFERVPAILDDAVRIASLIHNPPWTLPEPTDWPAVELFDPALATPAAAMAAARETTDRLRQLVEAERASGVRLSAAELFLTSVEEELRNSRGIEVGSNGTRVLLEMTLLARGDPEEAEHFRQVEARRMEDLNLDEAVAEGAEMARDTTRAVGPRTRLGPTVISGEALGQLMGPPFNGALGAYLYQTSADTAYAKLSRLELGQPVYRDVSPEGDLLTLRANARRPLATTSYRFDEEGVPAHDVTVIQDGVLRARTATQRYAQYLGIPTTGRPGGAEVDPGNVSTETLLEGPALYQLVAFSASNVDPQSGDFGMEIRLGYEIGPHGRRPIKGGSVTGNLFEAMARARFSAETREFTAYAGPAAIRFESLQVAGED